MKLNKVVKRSLISTGILLVISFVVATGMIIVNYKELKTSNKSSIEEVVGGEGEFDDEEKVHNNEEVEISESEKILEKYTEYNPIHKEGSAELLKSNATILINRAREMNRNLDFKGANKLLTEALRENSLGEEKEHTLVKRLYSDSVIMSSFEDMLADGLAVDILLGLKDNWIVDMENFLIAAMYLPLDEREALYVSLDAVNPALTGPIQIISTEEFGKEQIESLSEEFNQRFVAASKYEIEREGHGFDVVIVQFEDGNYGIAKFYASKKNTYEHKTINEWMQIRKELNMN